MITKEAGNIDLLVELKNSLNVLTEQQEGHLKLADHFEKNAEHSRQVAEWHRQQSEVMKTIAQSFEVIILATLKEKEG